MIRNEDARLRFLTPVLATALAVGLTLTPFHLGERLAPQASLQADRLVLTATGETVMLPGLPNGTEAVVGAPGHLEVRRVAAAVEPHKALYPPPKALYPPPAVGVPPVEVIRGETKTQHYQPPPLGPPVEVIRGETKTQHYPPPAVGGPPVEVIRGETKTQT